MTLNKIVEQTHKKPVNYYECHSNYSSVKQVLPRKHDFFMRLKLELTKEVISVYVSKDQPNLGVSRTV